MFGSKFFGLITYAFNSFPAAVFNTNNSFVPILSVVNLSFKEVLSTITPKSFPDLDSTKLIVFGVVVFEKVLMKYVKFLLKAAEFVPLFFVNIVVFLPSKLTDEICLSVEIRFPLFELD